MSQAYPTPDWNAPVYRSGPGSGRRSRPPKSLQQAILARQDDRCFYCGLKIGTVISREGRTLHLKLHWDHALPFSYVQANPQDNWVAACHVCNLIKRNLVFTTVVEAQDFIRHQRFLKGYRP